METRANYLLIGAFTLAGFLGILGFFLWFARFELDRQFDYYDVLFSSVAGLSNASEVRFAGLPVGQVVSVALDPERTGLIQVRLEVQAGTPVRTSSFATIESLGVTGVSFVGISPGETEDPMLMAVADDPIPEIPSRRSPLQSLTENAPQILDEVLEISRSMAELLGPVTQDRVAAILENVEASSGSLDAALADVSDVAGTIATAAEDIARFTDRLESISAQATTTLQTADESLRQVTELAARTESTLDTGEAALASARDTFDAAQGFVAEDLSRLAGNADRTLAALRTETERLGAQASATLDALREVGALANARLGETEATIAAADAALAEVSAASDAVAVAARNLDGLVTGDGAAAVAGARDLIADADALVVAALDMAETDLPAILDDVRQATATAARTVESVGADLSTAAGRAEAISDDVAQALGTVADTFERANATLSRLDSALVTGESALAAADDAFTSADRLLNDEVAGMAADLRTGLERLDAAIASVTQDVPAITGALRTAAERANATLGEIAATADRLAPPLRVFSEEGLPQYSRLAREARTLVANLDNLVRQIERDPARFFLGNEEPAFRR